MKRIILLIIVVSISVLGFAQSKNVQNAYNAYNRQDRDGLRIKMKEAKEFIDLAYNHESTSNDPKMWNYRAKIYLEIMQNHPELDENAMFEATEAHIRCLDKDKKGRLVVRKWTREEQVLDGLIQCGVKLFNGAAEDFGDAQYAKAIDKYNEIFRIIPLDKENFLKRANITPGTIYYNLYLSSSRLGDEDAQLKYLQKCIDLNTNDPNIYQNMSKIYSDKGDYDKAIEYIRKGQEMFPGEISLLETEINLLLSTGKSNSEIINRLTEAIELDDLREELFIVRAQRYIEEEMFDLAEADLLYVLREINPESSICINNLNVVYLTQIQTLDDEKDKHYRDRKMIKALDTELELLYNKVLPHLVKYVDLNPTSKEGLNNLSVIYYKLGMEKESTETRNKLNSL